MDTQITIETDESGFWLRVETEHRVWRCRITDPEALYDHVKGEIGPWLRERDEARAAYESQRPEYDPRAAYAARDPKHPTYHDRMSGLSDDR